MSHYREIKHVSMQEIKENLNCLVGSLEKDNIDQKVRIEDTSATINIRAFQVWLNHLLRHGNSIMRYAKGLAAMRGAIVIEEIDIARAYKMVNKGLHKELLGEDEDPTTF